jgi:hypothetical protein
MEYLNTERLLRHTPLPSRVSIAVGSREELDDLVKKPEPFVQRYDAAGVYAKYIEPWFHARDGQAYSRVARVILEAGKNRSVAHYSGRYGMAARGSFSKPRILQCLQGVAACVVGSLAVAKLRERTSRARATKSMDIGNIRRDLERIANVKGRKSSYCVAHERHPLHKAKMASIRVFLWKNSCGGS